VRDARLHSAGWQARSIPKVPSLPHCVRTGAYFGRVKIQGKTFRESTGTNVLATAKLLLGGFIKKNASAPRIPSLEHLPPTARFLFKDKAQASQPPCLKFFLLGLKFITPFLNFFLLGLKFSPLGLKF
jgi:hypothetical protein